MAFPRLATPCQLLTVTMLVCSCGGDEEGPGTGAASASSGGSSSVASGSVTSASGSGIGSSGAGTGGDANAGGGGESLATGGGGGTDSGGAGPGGAGGAAPAIPWPGTIEVPMESADLRGVRRVGEDVVMLFMDDGQLGVFDLIDYSLDWFTLPGVGGEGDTPWRMVDGAVFMRSTPSAGILEVMRIDRTAEVEWTWAPTEPEDQELSASFGRNFPGGFAAVVMGPEPEEPDEDEDGGGGGPLPLRSIRGGTWDESGAASFVDLPGTPLGVSPTGTFFSWDDGELVEMDSSGNEALRCPVPWTAGPSNDPVRVSDAGGVALLATSRGVERVGASCADLDVIVDASACEGGCILLSFVGERIAVVNKSSGTKLVHLHELDGTLVGSVEMGTCTSGGKSSEFGPECWRPFNESALSPNDSYVVGEIAVEIGYPALEHYPRVARVTASGEDVWVRDLRNSAFTRTSTHSRMTLPDHDGFILITDEWDEHPTCSDCFPDWSDFRFQITRWHDDGTLDAGGP